MRSLKESLFDKDIVTRDIPMFGDLFEVSSISYPNCPREYSGASALKLIMSNFNEQKLKRDIKPLNLSKVEGYYEDPLDLLRYILALINQMPVIGEIEQKPFSQIFIDELKEILDNYKNRGRWTDNRASVTMFIDRYGSPYIRFACGHPWMYFEVFYKNKK